MLWGWSLTYSTCSECENIILNIQNSSYYRCLIFKSMTYVGTTLKADDLMLVGESLVYSNIIEQLMSAEGSLQREINPTLFTVEEYRTRLEDEQSFLQRVMEQEKMMIKGEIDDIGKNNRDKHGYVPQSGK